MLIFCGLMVPCFFLCELLLSEFLMFFMLSSVVLIHQSWEVPKMMSMFFFFDKMSMFLCILTLWLTSLILMTLSNYRYILLKMKKSTLLICFLNFTLVMMFMSMKWMIFFILFEFSMVPILLLILGWGYQPERLEAYYNFFFFTTFPAMPFLMYLLTFTPMNMMISSIPIMENQKMSVIAFMSMMVFLVKIPVFLFHFWLPKAHVEAPVGGSMILAGILLKMGGYGLIRLLPLFSKSFFNYLLMGVSMMGMIFSCLMCFFSPDLKSIIAYSSVSHMNFMIASLMCVKSVAMFGSMLMMISHALTSSGLFYLCDVLYKRTSSRSLLLNKSFTLISPMLSFWWYMFSLLNMAFPFTAGNLSELFLGVSVMKEFFSLGMMILFMYFLFSAYYVMYLYYMINHGSLSKTSYYWPMDMKENLILICHFVPCMGLTLSAYSMIL